MATGAITLTLTITIILTDTDLAELQSCPAIAVD
jgi:hypothetical protein